MVWPSDYTSDLTNMERVYLAGTALELPPTACRSARQITYVASLRHSKHSAGRGDAAQGVRSERDERGPRFGGEGAGDEDGAVKRTA